jgi:hypothetical protein
MRFTTQETKTSVKEIASTVIAAIGIGIALFVAFSFIWALGE